MALVMPVHARDNLLQDLTQYTLRFPLLPFLSLFFVSNGILKEKRQAYPQTLPLPLPCVRCFALGN